MIHKFPVTQTFDTSCFFASLSNIEKSCTTCIKSLFFLIKDVLSIPIRWLNSILFHSTSLELFIFDLSYTIFPLKQSSGRLKGGEIYGNFSELLFQEFLSKCTFIKSHYQSLEPLSADARYYRTMNQQDSDLIREFRRKLISYKSKVKQTKLTFMKNFGVKVNIDANVYTSWNLILNHN